MFSKLSITQVLEYTQSLRPLSSLFILYIFDASDNMFIFPNIIYNTEPTGFYWILTLFRLYKLSNVAAAASSEQDVRPDV